MARSAEPRAARLARLPQPRFDDALPVNARRAEIRAAIERHPVVIVCGETGSGKTTQLPKNLLEMKRGVDGWIGHTQPRRIAARSVAARIAFELGVELGSAVGYKTHFADKVRPESFVKLMTDVVITSATIDAEKFSRHFGAAPVIEVSDRLYPVEALPAGGGRGRGSETPMAAAGKYVARTDARRVRQGAPPGPRMAGPAR